MFIRLLVYIFSGVILITAASPLSETVAGCNRIDEVGDYVLAQDVGTGEVSLKEVTDTFIRTSDHIRYLTTVDEEGDIQTIETTDAHPFWVVTDNPDLSRAASEIVIENGTVLYHENLAVTENGYYVEAKDLRIGDVFIGANGELTTLTDTYREEFPNGVTVYNFSVEGNHNYYVIANLEAYENGVSVVLVHNADYNIQQGVHRAAAARDIGMENIRANVNAPDGRILKENIEVPIKDLHSPRAALEPEKYQKNLEKMIKSPDEMPPIGIMPVTIPRHPSIMDVH